MAEEHIENTLLEVGELRVDPPVSITVDVATLYQTVLNGCPLVGDSDSRHAKALERMGEVISTAVEACTIE